MQRHKQEHQAAEQTTATEQKFLAALEQSEIFREEIETLNLELRYLQQQLLEQEQELIATNQELVAINQELSTASRLENLSVDEVKALARTILKSNKSTSDSLAELIGAIYGCAVELEQLQQKGNCSSSANFLHSA